METDIRYRLTPFSSDGPCLIDRDTLIFTAEKDTENGHFGLRVDFDEYEEDAYLFLPACVYNGNRIRRIKRDYPPMYRPSESGIDCEPLMTDVPALNPDGSGKIEVTSGDLATPCVGVYYRHKKKGFLLFTEQQVKNKNIGFTVTNGALTLTFPADRSETYRFCSPHTFHTDTGIALHKGEKLQTKLCIKAFYADSVPAFLDVFFTNRKCLLSNPRAENLYTQNLWETMERHFNEVNWSGEYVSEINRMWQPGWAGGGMSSYILMRYGNPTSVSHAVSTLDFLASHQGKSGFYVGLVVKGKNESDSFFTPGMECSSMIRKNADALYFLFKHFSIPDRIPKPVWVDSARKCADAFVTLYERYGKIGQLVHYDTGEMMVGCSCAGTMAPAALAKAYEYFGDERYLRVAEALGDDFHAYYNREGYTSGGPGEILGAPDSESAFALLESDVILYEITKKPLYLSYAASAAALCSSWVVSYSYRFPEESEFGRLKINTVGAVFANVQNKHAAPGICTLSGDSLYKLWQYTGDGRCLELIRDIAICIPQCVSRTERPIYSMDNPPQKLPNGYICERVNMSDWEGPHAVGGVYNGSNWCETSLVLTYFELIRKYPNMSE